MGDPEGGGIDGGSSGSPPTTDTTPTLTDEGEGLGPSDASKTAQSDALAEPVLLDMDSGAAQLLSTAVPDGLSNPYSSAQGGWTNDPQEVESYANAAGPSGPLSPYVGSDVDPYTSLPAAAATNPNAFTDGQNVNPYEDFQNAASSAGIPTDASQWSGFNGSAMADANSNGFSDGQNSGSLDELWKAYGGNSIDTSQYQASNVSMGAGDPRSGQKIVDDTYSLGAQDFDLRRLDDGNTYYHYQINIDGIDYDAYKSENRNVLDWSKVLLVPVPPAPPPAPPAPPPLPAAAPPAAPIAAPPTQTEQEWTAGWHGMVDSLIEYSGNPIYSVLFPTVALQPFLPKLPNPFDYLKFGPPAATGNKLRDHELRDSYNKGHWFPGTVAAAAPFGFAGVFGSLTTALGKISGAADELAILEQEISGAADELPALGENTSGELPALENEISGSLPPAGDAEELYGPFSHQINKGGLSDIVANNRLISTPARTVAGGGEAVRAGFGEAQFLQDKTDIEFFTELKPVTKYTLDWATNKSVPVQADWPMPEGEYLNIRLQRIFNEDGTIDIFDFDTP